jgi:hypothetical protein
MYGAAQKPQAIISIPYKPMIAYGDGRIPQESYVQQLEYAMQTNKWRNQKKAILSEKFRSKI